MLSLHLMFNVNCSAKNSNQSTTVSSSSTSTTVAPSDNRSMMAHSSLIRDEELFRIFTIVSNGPGDRAPFSTSANFPSVPLCRDNLRRKLRNGSNEGCETKPKTSPTERTGAKTRRRRRAQQVQVKFIIISYLQFF